MPCGRTAVQYCTSNQRRVPASMRAHTTCAVPVDCQSWCRKACSRPVIGLRGWQTALRCRFDMWEPTPGNGCALRCWSLPCTPPGKAVRPWRQQGITSTSPSRCARRSRTGPSRAGAWPGWRRGSTSTPRASPASSGATARPSRGTPTARSGTTAHTARPARSAGYATPAAGGSVPPARRCAMRTDARTTSASGVRARTERPGSATAARGARPAPWSTSPTRPGWPSPRPRSASSSQGGGWT